MMMAFDEIVNEFAICVAAQSEAIAKGDSDTGNKFTNMIYSNAPYPHFIPPGNLGEKTPPEWSRAEAIEYAQWLESCIHDRVWSLLRHFGMDEATPSAALLDSLGQRVADTLVREPFSKEGKLTNQGHALAADMGMLLAMLLKQENPDLEWEIVRKPKSDVHYNQPVFMIADIPFNSIHISTMQALAILDGSKDGSAWRQVFDNWNRRACRA